MALPPGIFSSFTQGMMVPQQFKLRKQQLERGKISMDQARENLLKSQIMNKYTGRQQEAQLQKMTDAHQAAQIIAPYLGAEKQAQIASRIMQTQQAPEKLRLTQENLKVSQANLALRQKPGFRESQQFRALPVESKLNLIASGYKPPFMRGGGPAFGPSRQQQRPQQVQQAPTVPQLPQPTISPTLSQYLDQTSGAAPLGPSVPGGTQQVPPAIEAQQEAHMAPASDIPYDAAAAHQDEVMRKTAQMAVNKKLTPTAIQNRAASARVFDKFFSNKKNRSIIANAVKYAGAIGKSKKLLAAIKTKGTPEYNKYLQFKNILVANFANQLRQVEALSVQPQQREEIERMIASWDKGIESWSTTPVRAFSLINESFRQLQAIGKSLTEESEPIYKITEEKPFKPITAAEASEGPSKKGKTLYYNPATGKVQESPL